MYNQFFKLQEKPFNLTPKANIFHDNEGSAPAYRALVDGVSRGERVILLTGDTGTGKTLCAQKLLAELEKNVEYCGISIPFTSLPLDDMLGYICGELNLNFGLGRNENKLEILEMFLTHGVSPIRKVVIVIDEAQNLAPEIFNGLADLLDISKNSQRDVQIVVMARSESDLKLNHPHMLAFNHHITLRCHLRNLQPHEIASYIKYHLDAAGAAYSDIFTEDAVARIQALTQGRARAINTLCDQALNVAAAESEAIITVEHVNMANRQQQFDDTIEMRTSMISDAINRMMDERNQEEEIDDSDLLEKSTPVESEAEKPESEVISLFTEEQAIDEQERQADKFEKEIIEFNQAHTNEVPATVQSSETEDDFSKTYHNIPVKKSSSGFWTFAFSSAVVAVVAWYFFPQLQTQLDNLTSGNATSEIKATVPQTVPKIAILSEEVSSTVIAADNLPKEIINERTATIELADESPIVIETQTKEPRELLDDTSEILEIATVTESSDGTENVDSNGQSPQDRQITIAQNPISEIEQLFSQAIYQVSVLQLTSPRNDNAFSSYQQILKIDPENTQAIEGIEALKDMFMSWAKNNEQANKHEKAKRYYQKILIIEPDNVEALAKLANFEEEYSVADESLDISSGLLELVMEGNYSAIRTLLDKGAYPDIQDQRGNTPLMLATDIGSLRIVTALLEGGANPNLKNKIGETALINAVWKNQIEIADQLIGNNADVNGKNNRGWTALMYAAIHGHAELFNTLLDHSADQEAKTEDKKTTLTIAAHNGQNEVVNILIQNGARVNGRDKDGWTPLMHAVWNSHVEVVQALLSSESDIDQKNLEGWTPLMMAAWNGERQIVQMLLGKGADRSVRNPAGSTALDLATDQQFHAVSSLLR